MLWVSAFDLAGNSTTAGPFQIDVLESPPPPQRIYVPLVSQAYVQAPDLVVQSIAATSDGVQVVIRNQGSGAVWDEFWVDVYVDPSAAPAQVNQTWDHLGSQGIAWGVTSPASSALGPGGVITLTVGDAYYRADASHVSWPLPVGTRIYAQVDSANDGSAYGAVREIHEALGTAYNNIAGPVLSTHGATAQTRPQPSGQVEVTGGVLPKRR